MQRCKSWRKRKKPKDLSSRKRFELVFWELKKRRESKDDMIRSHEALSYSKKYISIEEEKKSHLRILNRPWRWACVAAPTWCFRSKHRPRKTRCRPKMREHQQKWKTHTHCYLRYTSKYLCNNMVRKALKSLSSPGNAGKKKVWYLTATEWDSKKLNRGTQDWFRERKIEW